MKAVESGQTAGPVGKAASHALNKDDERKKPALTKAERRALQEHQRALKQKRVNVQGGPGSSKAAVVGQLGSSSEGPQFDPFSPCGFALSGICRFGSTCCLQHDVEYADAIREQWLDPGSAAKRDALRKAACQAASAAAAGDWECLFPRVFAEQVVFESHTTAQPADCCGGGEGEGAGGNADYFGNEGEGEGPDEPQTTARYLAVIDLEGKDHIIEFPCLLLDLKLRTEVGRFQRRVHPELTPASAGPAGPAATVTTRSSDAPSVSFPSALTDFEAWLNSTLPNLQPGGAAASGLADAGEEVLVVSCGDFDCCHIRSHCERYSLATPALFDRWANLKQCYGEHYIGAGCQRAKWKKKFAGMKNMLARVPKQLGPSGEVLHGFHHVGMHDVENISRCAVHLLDQGGAIVQNSSVFSSPTV